MLGYGFPFPPPTEGKRASTDLETRPADLGEAKPKPVLATTSKLEVETVSTFTHQHRR